MLRMMIRHWLAFSEDLDATFFSYLEENYPKTLHFLCFYKSWAAFQIAKISIWCLQRPNFRKLLKFPDGNAFLKKNSSKKKTQSCRLRSCHVDDADGWLVFTAMKPGLKDKWLCKSQAACNSLASLRMEGFDLQMNFQKIETNLWRTEHQLGLCFTVRESKLKPQTIDTYWESKA